MPLEFRRNEVCLTGTCAAEEASEVAEWLAGRKRPKVNLAGCGHLHTSLLQTLLALRPAISAAPTDPFLSRWILPLIAGPADRGKGAQQP